QLAAPVAAHRSQRQSLGQCRGQARAPYAGEQSVNEGGARAHQRLDGFLSAEALLKFLLAALQQLAAGGRGVLAFGKQRRELFEQRPLEARCGRVAELVERGGVGDHARPTALRSAALKVRTSCPVGVTSTMCS